MQFYFNEASLQGQFENSNDFLNLMAELFAARARSDYLKGMRTTTQLPERMVSDGRNFRQVVQSWRGTPLASAILAWVGKYGPFIEEDRLPEENDLFQCLGVDVSDGGLGEAGRRAKSLQEIGSYSLPGGERDFATNPLPVIHGFEDEPFAIYPIENFWNADEALAKVQAMEPPASSWRELIECSRARFPKVSLPDAIWNDHRLAKEPFDGVIRDQVYSLLDILQRFMRHRDELGGDSAEVQELIQNFFAGDRARFSPESPSNRTKFADDLTFKDPGGGPDIFGHWHGKISHRHYRMHIEWPVPPHQNQLKVLYIGPKLTKK